MRSRTSGCPPPDYATVRSRWGRVCALGSSAGNGPCLHRCRLVPRNTGIDAENEPIQADTAWQASHQAQQCEEKRGARWLAGHPTSGETICRQTSISPRRQQTTPPKRRRSRQPRARGIRCTNAINGSGCGCPRSARAARPMGAVRSPVTSGTLTAAPCYAEKHHIRRLHP